MNHRVSVVSVAPRLFAAVRARMMVDEVPNRFREFLDQVYAVRERLPLDGQNIFVYRPADGDKADVEFGVGVTGPFDAIGPVLPTSLPACNAATTTHWGSYSGLRAAHNEVKSWCRENNRRLTGTRWEVYGHWSDDPAKLRTDVFHELA
jgi:effector-binding domain-containing protein